MERSGSASGMVAATALVLLVLLIVVMGASSGFQPPDGGIHIGIAR